jgi:hypothetical protein
MPWSAPARRSIEEPNVSDPQAFPPPAMPSEPPAGTVGEPPAPPAARSAWKGWAAAGAAAAVIAVGAGAVVTHHDTKKAVIWRYG